MKRFRSSTLGFTLIFSLIAGLIVLGGCTADTLTGPTPEEEEVTVQQTTQDQTGQATDDGSNEDGSENNQSSED